MEIRMKEHKGYKRGAQSANCFLSTNSTMRDSDWWLCSLILPMATLSSQVDFPTGPLCEQACASLWSSKVTNLLLIQHLSVEKISLGQSTDVESNKISGMLIHSSRKFSGSGLAVTVCRAIVRRFTAEKHRLLAAHALHMEGRICRESSEWPYPNLVRQVKAGEDFIRSMLDANIIMRWVNRDPCAQVAINTLEQYRPMEKADIKKFT
ncbi:hypothetical protein ACTXT7_001077 [Hymenolepis weldensis]